MSFVAKIEAYANEKGNKIEHFRIVSGETPPDYPAYRGFAVLNLPTPQGTMTKEFTFPISALSVDDAFLQFEALAQKCGTDLMEQLKLEIHRKSILTPGQAGWRGKINGQ